MSALPAHWKMVQIRDVIIPFETVDPTRTPDTSFTYVDIGSIDNKTQSITEPRTILGKDAPSRARRRIHTGDVLFATVRTYLKNIAVVPKELDSAVTSTGIAILRPSNDIESRFLFNWTCSSEFLGRIGKAMDGTMYPAVTDRDVQDQAVPLPPIDEQRRIIAKLDELFNHSKSARDELAHIPKLIERYRRAIIRFASTGKLTADWRTHNKPKELAVEFLLRVSRDRLSSYEQECVKAKRDGTRKPKRPTGTLLSGTDANGCGHIPTGWSVARVQDIADCLDYLRVPINKQTRISRAGEVPYYGANGQVGWIDDYLFNDDLVLVVEDETFIGREKPFSYVIRGKAWVNNHAHVLKALGGMPTEFLNILLSYYDFTPITSGSTGRRKLTQEALLNAPVWIPPRAEQIEIVRRVERALSSIDTIAGEGRRAEALLGRLEQATLERAFRGELVPLQPSAQI